MKFQIVKLKGFSGDKATIYSVILGDDSVTLFERFIKENLSRNKNEVESIRDRLLVIGNDTGARESFFKTKEGKPGDGVCALYDEPDSNLRLYCIRYGTVAVILGGGGSKPKIMHALQESKKLTAENKIVRQISKMISRAIKDRELQWAKDGKELIGNLFIDDYED